MADSCESLLGTDIEVLCEGFDRIAECFYGRSYADAPDIDGKVYFSASRRVRPGEFVTVRIDEVLDYDLLGKLV
jgi:ribosomal protein S12 methylthiotransferase